MPQGPLLNPALLEALRCPRTQQPLHLANEEEHTRWKPLDEAADDFLVVQDGSTAYPIEDGFPILLLERALHHAVETHTPRSD